LRWRPLRRKKRIEPGDADTTAHMRRALQLVLAGDLGAAEVELSRAARVDSSSSDAYMALANLYRARGEISRAIQIHQILLLKPDLPEDRHRETLLGLALDFRAGGFLHRASASFEELLELDPTHPQALRELERIRVETGRWQEALEIRKRIGAGDPRSSAILAHLWTGLGRGALQEGDVALARKAFRRALGQDRKCAEAHIALGDQCAKEGKTRRAVAQWRRALPLNPAIGQLLYGRFWEAFTALDELAAFESLLRDRLDGEPADHLAALWLARALSRQGRLDEALSGLRRLLDRVPDLLDGHAEIGRLLLQEGRTPEALKAFEELLNRLPSQPVRLRCQACGTPDTNLHWRCPQCGEWDSFV
jgi:lipopolysaccharide biosynthesis regulator YciM